MDLINQFLPYVVKYDSLDRVKACFDDFYKYKSEAEKAYLWIDLQCQAAEIVASTDSKKSADYLELAKKEREEKLWTYFFSPRRAEITHHAELATARIKKAASKCQGLSS